MYGKPEWRRKENAGETTIFLAAGAAACLVVGTERNNMKTYKTLNPEQIAAERANIKASQQNRWERVRNCEVEETDCGLSMKAEDHRLDVLEKMEALNAAGGKHAFLVLTDLQGVPVDAFEHQGQYGWRWCVEGKWMPQYGTRDTARRLANLASRGYKWTKIEFPAKVATESAGGWNWWAVLVPAERQERRIIRES